MLDGWQKKSIFCVCFQKIWHKIYFSIIAFRMKIRSRVNENEKPEKKDNNNEKKTERDQRTCQAFFY